MSPMGAAALQQVSGPRSAAEACKMRWLQLEHERRQLQQMDSVWAEEQRALEMHIAYQAGYRDGRYEAAIRSATQPQPAVLDATYDVDGLEAHAHGARLQMASVPAQLGAAQHTLRSHAYCHILVCLCTCAR